MASLEKRGTKWIVRYRTPAGAQRTRTCPDWETAKKLRREIESSYALGVAWEPADARAIPALVEFDEDGQVAGGLIDDFLEARRGRMSLGTRRHYNRALIEFLMFLAARNPRRRKIGIDLLTRDAIEVWFGELVTLPRGSRPHMRTDRADQPLSIATARLKVQAVAACWEWAYDSDKYGDIIGRPRMPDLPMPVTTPAVAPTWAQMDACIAQAYVFALTARTSHERAAWTWRARMLIMLRFTGLRVDEQILHIDWADVVPLEAATLVLRGELGKSARERAGRLLPLCPHLVEELAGWGTRTGFIVAPHLATSRRTRRDWEPEVLNVTRRRSEPRATARAWAAARVPVEGLDAEPVPSRIWDEAPGRRKGQPHHAFRKGFKTGLALLGADQEVRDYLVGHHRGIDEHYLDTFMRAVAILAKVPPLASQVLEARTELAAATERKVIAVSFGRK